MTRRGWCPGVYDPMPSGDGLLVRVKPPGARMTAAALRAVADAAERCGNGAVELTRRGYLQVRGLRPESVAPLAAAMVASGLAGADPARERRRRVIASPPFDPALVARIEATQEAGADWDEAPDKFAVSVNCADGDVWIADGGTFLPGGTLCAEADAAEALPRLLKAARVMGGGRMRALVAQRGDAAIFAAAGLRAEPRAFRAAEAEETFGVAFGLLDAAMLRDLAPFADEFGAGSLLLTPRRAVALDRPGVAARAAAEALGLLTGAADPRRGVAACAGRPACASATVPAREDAAVLARFASDLHVSGCAKGCARSAPAAVTLVGRDGLYDLVRDGRADGAPSRRGLTRQAAAALLAAS